MGVVPVVALAHDTEATHIITHIESDPGSESSTWHWDFMGRTAFVGRGSLGCDVDSAFLDQSSGPSAGARVPRFVVVDICMLMDGSCLGASSGAGQHAGCATSLELVRGRVLHPKDVDCRLSASIRTDRCARRATTRGVNVVVKLHLIQRGRLLEH